MLKADSLPLTQVSESCPRGLPDSRSRTSPPWKSLFRVTSWARPTLKMNQSLRDPELQCERQSRHYRILSQIKTDRQLLHYILRDASNYWCSLLSYQVALISLGFSRLTHRTVEHHLHGLSFCMRQQVFGSLTAHFPLS